ncbi:predicted protein [Chaetomium globosum CBS 148.51]|uniref:Uncharacterized protein n=1 Tax=Chaetomium globosum (strain ATCC 6205 / CBS 148.51 / DSM 1962 / NBRC 6347 / NRRL 1970) TaxID=306901 RepID=Q2GVY7_CHAGB|nr:uncharacterized protein CHGG_07867 [Chaetomium globosum CBS 148.51]EAQ86614.1 predicted protein [Chaetomium globosum CBS 148.51]
MAVYAVKRQSRVVACALGTANEPNVTSPHLRHGCSGRPTASSPGGSGGKGKPGSRHRRCRPALDSVGSIDLPPRAVTRLQHE